MALICGGASVHPPGVTATSAIATEGRASAGCASAIVATETLTNPTSTSPMILRVISPSCCLEKAQMTRVAAHATIAPFRLNA